MVVTIYDNIVQDRYKKETLARHDTSIYISEDVTIKIVHDIGVVDKIYVFSTVIWYGVAVVVVAISWSVVVVELVSVDVSFEDDVCIVDR